MTTPLTHKELVLRAERWLLNSRGCGFCLSELRVRKSLRKKAEIPDAIGWLYGISYLIECKTSRNDFLADGKKLFRQRPKKGMGNYRFYMTEPDLIAKDELPERWGLLYVYKTQVRMIVKAAGFFSKDIAWNERPLLCSALRRVHLRGDLKKIYDPGTQLRRR
jgi:hypothetical protein